jgi:hypothetical protein
LEVRIDHAAHRVAGQNNSPTWLHWSSLMPTIRNQDFTGWYLIIEKYSSDYKLRLSRRPPEEQSRV